MTSPADPADPAGPAGPASLVWPAASAAPAAPVWPARGPVRTWLADLLLGARLALGGTRSGWLRVALTGVGIGVTVTVLLVAASAGPVRSAQQHRTDAASFVPGEVLPGVDPLHLQELVDSYRGREIRLTYVRPGGPTAPVPPGLARLPGPGEQVVSPALADLLASPEGELLRPRFPGRVIGTVAPEGLPGGPHELAVYAGSADLRSMEVYGFGRYDFPPGPLPAVLWVLLVVGVVVLLVPMFVLVTSISRLSAAERQRRLAAMRLVGAGAGQVRRIAAGEVLVGALLGLLLGTGLYLGLRPLAERDVLAGVADFAGVRPFVADVVPSWPLTVLIAVLVPALAVLTAVAALRRTLIEPLGVVRQSTPARRRGWWRLVPAVAGIALLAGSPRIGGLYYQDRFVVVLVVGAVLLLAAVPAVLPWVLDLVVRRPRDETPALQLASRRLQLDSGPPARLVAGIAVTLAGAIAVGALLAAAEQRYSPDGPAPVAEQAYVDLTPPAATAAGLPDRLRAVPGVTRVLELTLLQLTAGPDQPSDSVVVAACPVLRLLADVPGCVDGRMFRAGDSGALVGRAALVVGPDGTATPSRVQVPAAPAVAVPRPGPADGSLLATPGAVRSVPVADRRGLLVLDVDGRPDTIELVRDALAPTGWRADLSSRYYRNLYPGPVVSREARDFVAIRRALAAGALLLLAVAAVALLALCLQQVRDGRRPLAALAAAGVPRAVLARSLVWQNAILTVTAVVLADVTGVTLGLLLLRLADAPATIGWAAPVATLSAAALGTVAAATALTLPAVRAATRPSGLRAE